MEVGFQPPSSWLPVRVRQLNPDGSSQIIAEPRETKGTKHRPVDVVSGKVRTGDRAQLVVIIVTVSIALLGLVALSMVVGRRFKTDEGP